MVCVVLFNFFVVSDKWEEIGNAINSKVERGCTLIDARGFYTGRELGMLFRSCTAL